MGWFQTSRSNLRLITNFKHAVLLYHLKSSDLNVLVFFLCSMFKYIQFTIFIYNMDVIEWYLFVVMQTHVYIVFVPVLKVYYVNDYIAQHFLYILFLFECVSVLLSGVSVKEGRFSQAPFIKQINPWRPGEWHIWQWIIYGFWWSLSYDHQLCFSQ